MDEALSVFELVTMGGPIGLFGWVSLLAVIIMGCILLCLPPRSGRQVAVVDIYAACLHVQLLVFILCVPLSLAAGAYLMLGPYRAVVARDMLLAAGAVLLNLSLVGTFLFAISIRHRTAPTIKWLPAASVLIAIVSLFTVWEFKMAACIAIDRSYDNSTIAEPSASVDSSGPGRSVSIEHLNAAPRSH